MPGELGKFESGTQRRLVTSHNTKGCWGKGGGGVGVNCGIRSEYYTVNLLKHIKRFIIRY